MLIYQYYTQLVEYILLGIFSLFFIIQVFYYLRFFIFPFSKYVPTENNEELPVSVIICARNEAKNLNENLPAILNQQYNNYEVIVVNDCSEDDTDFVVAALMKEHKHLRTTSIHPDRKFTHGKKLAITVGIKSATNEHLVFIDADCKPVSSNWLKHMQSNFKGKEIVLGYGGYEHKKGLLNRYLRYDATFIALQYLGFALVGKPYMGIGRNLAYTKELFFKNKGFASHYGLLSGDDDLFVNETATKENVSIELRPDSFTRSVPKQRWGEWFAQKIRHFSTAGRYKKSDIFRLGMEPLSRFGFYVLFVLCLLTTVEFYVPLALVLARLILQLITSRIIKRKLNDNKLFLLLPIFDIVSLIINFVIYLISLFRAKKLQWK